jgi:hypothetical protein
VKQRQLWTKWLLCSTKLFAFMSSLKPSWRLRCSVLFIVVSTMNLQRGRALVFEVINLNKQVVCVRGKSLGRQLVSEENVTQIQATVLMLSVRPEGGTLNIYQLYCEYNQIWYGMVYSGVGFPMHCDLCVVYCTSPVNFQFSRHTLSAPAQ